MNDNPNALNEQIALFSVARVSQPRELPPQLLSEPGVNLSTHRAPIVPTANDPRPDQ